jgi:phosphatidylethanolamine/phosphatidyl-N-methylethanolamine N-methyltransferase
MNNANIIKSYNRWAPGYDLLFAGIVQNGRREAIGRMGCRAGENVLDVGVGTGLSLPYYPRETHVVGIDLTPSMLAKAKRRIDRDGLANAEVHVMDAQAMTFADNSFDRVVAMYVASVVPDPGRLVAEMKRVCKPGGDIFVVNHFTNNNPLVRSLETLVSPLSSFLGFRPDFPMDGFIAATGLDVVEIQPVNLFGYWTLVRARNDASVDGA